MEWEYIKEHDVYTLDSPIGRFNIHNLYQVKNIEFIGKYIGSEPDIDAAKEYVLQYLSLKSEELKTFLKLQDKT